MPKRAFDPKEHVEFENDAIDISDERFDRMAFAEDAIKKIRAPKTTVALCSSRSRVRIEIGRAWGREPGARWAVVAIPPFASKRAIAVAVAALATDARGPYAIDVLFKASSNDS
jgi:hypothetical protein